MDVAPVCAGLGVSRACYYRKQKPKGEPKPKPKPPRTLSPEERQQVLDLLHSDRFVDQSPQEVYATLLDEGTYLCSLRTMYRILQDHAEVRERRFVKDFSRPPFDRDRGEVDAFQMLVERRVGLRTAHQDEIQLLV